MVSLGQRKSLPYFACFNGAVVSVSFIFFHREPGDVAESRCFNWFNSCSLSISTQTKKIKKIDCSTSTTLNSEITPWVVILINCCKEHRPRELQHLTVVLIAAAKFTPWMLTVGWTNNESFSRTENILGQCLTLFSSCTWLRRFWASA